MFRHSILFYKIHNSERQDLGWIDLNLQQSFNDRNSKVEKNGRKEH